MTDFFRLYFPATFNGTDDPIDVKSFFLLFECVSINNRWFESDKLNFFSVFLKGDAYAYYKRHIEDNIEVEWTWETLRERYIQVFSTDGKTKNGSEEIGEASGRSENPCDETGTLTDETGKLSIGTEKTDGETDNVTEEAGKPYEKPEKTNKESKEIPEECKTPLDEATLEPNHDEA